MRTSLSLSEIAKQYKFHSPNSQWYREAKGTLRVKIENASDINQTSIVIDEIGIIKLPRYSMGQITSLDLFGLDEVILFSLYKERENRGLVLDLGSNIGLHSIILRKLGYEVVAVEPDPKHIFQLKKNLYHNQIQDIQLLEKAVSTQTGHADFLRVEGNTTGSHLAGSRGKSPYGKVSKFSVETIALTELLELFSETTLVKMDVEGFEADLICSLDSPNFKNIDFVLEVGSKESATLIFNHLSSLNILCMAQKTGWRQVRKLDDMPKSYKDGSLLIARSRPFS